MRFSLVDKIVELHSGVSITAVKTLSLAEEYLQDHFPLFPVMPGVLMLESLYQASAWLAREQDDFQQTVVLLKEARNVKYGNFVKPGQTLVITSQLQKRDGALASFKAQAAVEGEVAVNARLVLESFTLAERRPLRAENDAHIRRRLREQFAILMSGAAAAAPAGP